MYYLHYLRFTLDERKTLTKISTRKISHNHSPNQRTLRTTKKQGENPPLKGKQQAIQKRAICITGGESKALGLHQETMEESGKHQELVLYTILHYLYQTSFILVYTVLENVINITNFSTKSENSKYYFKASTKFKTLTLFSTQGNCSKFSYKIQNHRRYLNVSRNIIT